MRRELEAALAALQLFVARPRRSARKAIAELKDQADESKLPLIEKAAAAETDADAEGASSRC